MLRLILEATDLAPETTAVSPAIESKEGEGFKGGEIGNGGVSKGRWNWWRSGGGGHIGGIKSCC